MFKALKLVGFFNLGISPSLDCSKTQFLNFQFVSGSLKNCD